MSSTPVAFLSAAAVALIGAAILWRWLEDAPQTAPTGA